MNRSQKHGLGFRFIPAGLAVIGLWALSGCGGGSGASASTANNGLTTSAALAVNATLNSTTGVSIPAPAVVPAAASTGAVLQPARFTVPMDDVETLSPLSSWANLQRDFGAKGDGVTDDTAALQKALNTIGHGGAPNVLYLPAGTYKISSTLTWAGNFSGPTGTTIIGDSPSTTSIVWAGPSGGTMLIQNGGTFFRYSRITWNGMKTAGYGVAQMWNTTSGTLYGGSTEHQDEVFMDMGIGIMAGRMGAAYGAMDSEGQIRRVTFLRNTFAGFDTGSWNALDWWIWDSQFINCARGASNNFAISDTGTTNGAGAFYIYRSLFQGSSVADVDIGNTGWFSMYHNTSVGSRRFFQAALAGRNGAAGIIVGNKILDTTDPISIINGNMGLLTLVDNQIRSLPGTTGPVVVMNNDANSRSVFSSGNQYSVSNPIGFQAPPQSSADRLTSINDSLVATASISSSLPVMPVTPTMVSRQVFEVSLGTDGAKNASAIQAAVNLAVKAYSTGSVNPVVHLPLGQYNISASIVIPPQVRIQLVGDELETTINWTGSGTGPVFQLQGPSYATLRNFQIWSGTTVPAIGISGADQAGGRIFIEGSVPGAVSAANILSTQISAQANPGINNLSLTNVGSWSSIGTGGLGPVSSTGNSSLSNVLIADTWYEGTATHLYRVDSGNFTYIGGNMGPANHAGTSSATLNDPAILISNLVGNVTFLDFGLDLLNVPAGIGVQISSETSNSNVLVMGAGASTNSSTDFFQRTTQAPSGNVGLYLSSKYITGTGDVPVPDEGSTSSSFVTKMLAGLRTLNWESTPYQAPAGATDVRIYRISAGNSGGVVISH